MIKEYIKLLAERMIQEKSRFTRETGVKFNKKEVLEKYKDDPYVLVHFSDLDKLGINPQSSYDTPVGIYGYPLSEMYEEVRTGKVPFAGDRKYLHIFKIREDAQESVVFINEEGKTDQDEKWTALFKELNNFKISDEDQEKIDRFKNVFNDYIGDISQLKEKFVSLLLAEKPEEEKERLFSFYYVKIFKEIDNFIEKIIDDIRNDSFSISERFIESAHNKIGWVIRAIRSNAKKDAKSDEAKETAEDLKDAFQNLLGEIDSLPDVDKENTKRIYEKVLREANIRTPFGLLWYYMYLTNGDAKKWNGMLRKELKISAVIDYGSGMVHGSEPTQGVAFSGRVIEHIGTIEDPYNFEKKEKNQKNLNSIVLKIRSKKWNEPNSEQWFAYIMKNVKNYFPAKEYDMGYFLDDIFGDIPRAYYKYFIPYSKYFNVSIWKEILRYVDIEYISKLIPDVSRIGILRDIMYVLLTKDFSLYKSLFLDIVKQIYHINASPSLTIDLLEPFFTDDRIEPELKEHIKDYILSNDFDSHVKQWLEY